MTSATGNQILALWCHPRSLSTAFMRMMAERGDVTVLHERYLYLYYVVQNPHLVIAQQLDRIEPWMYSSFDEITAGIETEADDRPVFFKDMAVHVWNSKGRYADDAFLSKFTNSFLIRDPRVGVLSHLKQNPDMVFEEVGYDAQLALFQRATEMTGDIPAVIDAADLERDPRGIVRSWCEIVGIDFIESALEWDAGVPELLVPNDPWHSDLYATTGFARSVESFPDELREHPRYIEFVERSLPFYEALRRHRID